MVRQSVNDMFRTHAAGRPRVDEILAAVCEIDANVGGCGSRSLDDYEMSFVLTVRRSGIARGRFFPRPPSPGPRCTNDKIQFKPRMFQWKGTYAITLCVLCLGNWTGHCNRYLRNISRMLGSNHVVAELEPHIPTAEEIQRQMRSAVERIRAKLAEPGEIARLLAWLLPLEPDKSKRLK